MTRMKEDGVLESQDSQGADFVCVFSVRVLWGSYLEAAL